MKLRFEVDQAECFRRGIDCPKSIVTIEVIPADISQEERALIADRLIGIDVCELINSGNGTVKMRTLEGAPYRIVANTPDYAGLINAVRKCQNEVNQRHERHRNCALAAAEAGLDTFALVHERKTPQK